MKRGLPLVEVPQVALVCLFTRLRVTPTWWNQTCDYHVTLHGPTWVCFEALQPVGSGNGLPWPWPCVIHAGQVVRTCLFDRSFLVIFACFGKLSRYNLAELKNSVRSTNYHSWVVFDRLVLTNSCLLCKNCRWWNRPVCVTHCFEMAGVLFEDIFDVKDIDPDGKKFDRGMYDTGALCQSSFGMCRAHPLE